MKGYRYKIIQLNSNSYHFFWQNTEERLAQCSSFGNLFLLLFSITDRSSFEEIERLGRFIRETKIHGEYSIVVVGTKLDLRDYRAVSEDEGHVVANKLGGTYFETSSADSYEGIERLFSYSIKSHLKSRFFDPERNKRVMGLKKLRDGLLLRTKSLYRSRGMTFWDQTVSELVDTRNLMVYSISWTNVFMSHVYKLCLQLPFYGLLLMYKRIFLGVQSLRPNGEIPVEKKIMFYAVYRRE